MTPTEMEQQRRPRKDLKEQTTSMAIAAGLHAVSGGQDHSEESQPVETRIEHESWCGGGIVREHGSAHRNRHKPSVESNPHDNTESDGKHRVGIPVEHAGSWAVEFGNQDQTERRKPGHSDKRQLRQETSR